MQTRVPFGLSLADQIQRMSGWKEPIVLSTAALILTRNVGEGALLDRIEVLVTERLKGAKPGFHQFYVGGYTHPNDPNLAQTTCREVQEELGVTIDANRLQLVGLFGPGLYLSALYEDGTHLRLDVSSTPAEPMVRFQLALFLTSVESELNFSPEDGEVKVIGWMSLRRMIETYGNRSDAFLYPHLLFDLVKYLSVGKVIIHPSSEPGRYQW